MTMTFVARDAGTSATRRRRERRLSSMLRHERMTVAMTLAELTHHSAPRRPTMARARGEESEMNNGTGQMTPHTQGGKHGVDDDGDVLAARPTPLVEVRPQPGVLRHTAAHIEDIVLFVQILDVLVPQLGGPGGGPLAGARRAGACRAGYRRAQDLLWTGSRSAPCVVVHGELNRRWKCLRSYPILIHSSGLPSRPSTFQFPMVEAIVGGGERSTRFTTRTGGAER